MALDLDQVYDAIDAMKGMKRYRPPTKNYFPTSAEIMTYANSDYENMIPYFLYLEECLTEEGKELHKEARSTLRKIISEKQDKGEII